MPEKRSETEKPFVKKAAPKKAAFKKTAPKGKTKGSVRGKRKPAPARSHGLSPSDVATSAEEAPDDVRALMDGIRNDGGVPLAAYRDPLQGRWVVTAALPVEKVAPTPFQRDVSEPHVDRLIGAMKRTGLYLDPIICVKEADEYWTPNGGHRLAALQRLGAKSVLALVVVDRQVMFKILAMNTEKAHALKERALEVIRMVRELAKLPGKETDYIDVLEEPSYVTLGLCYEQNGRFAGSAYQPILKRTDTFLELPLENALLERQRRAARVLELEKEVSNVMKGLRAKGFDSPYLRAFVVARINPLRFRKGDKTPEFDSTFDKLLDKARAFDVAKVKAQDISGSGGAPSED